MSTIQAPAFNRPLFQGTYGNVSMEEATVTLSAAAVDTEVMLLSLPAGIRMFMFVLVTSGLGEGVTIDLKVGDITVSSDNALADGETKTIGMVPVDIPEDTTLSMVVGGAPATGTLCVMPLYKSVGTN